jgi:mono/diheme cytochrome c family protein
MSESDQKAPPLSRGKTFLLGALGTGALWGLIVLCVPPKPAVVAEQAKPQRSEVSELETVAAVPPAADVRSTGGQGKDVYERFCTGCHGDDGKANTNFGRMMNPAPTNFYEGPWQGDQTPEAIIATVTQGKGAMPAYKKEITSDVDLQALAQYVLSLRKEQQK